MGKSQFNSRPSVRAFITALRITSAILILPVSARVNAQATMLNPPPIMTTDRAGVDLRSGQRIFSSMTLSIGDANSPVFSYSGVKLSAGASSDTPHASVRSRCNIDTNSNRCSSYALDYDLNGVTVEWTQSSGSSELDDGTIVYGTDKLQRKDGSIWEFNGSGNPFDPVNPFQGNLKRIIYPDGRILDYNYAGTKITSSLGYIQEITVEDTKWSISMRNMACKDCRPSDFEKISGNADHHPDNSSEIYTGFLSEISTNSNNKTKVGYQWQSNGFLKATVTDGAGRGFELLRSPTEQQKYSSPIYVLTCGARSTISQIKTEKNTTEYTYEFDDSTTCQSIKATSKDSNGDSITVEGKPGTIKVTDQLGRVTKYTTSYTQPPYPAPEKVGISMQSDGSRIQKIEYPEGNYVEYNYNRSNISEAIFHSKNGKQTRKISAVYPYLCNSDNAKYCNSPESITDSNGGTTDYTYHAESGMVSKITLPATDKSGVRSETRNDYKQYSASYYDEHGNPVTGSFVWKLEKSSTCATKSYDQCKGTEDEIVTSYGYDANLLTSSIEVKNGKGVVLSQTKQKFDSVGNLISVDGPISGSNDTIYYFYDSRRRQVGSITPNPDKEGTMRYLGRRVNYDGGGLVTSVETGTTVAANRTALDGMIVTNTTQNEYDKVGRKVKVSIKDGSKVISVMQMAYDSADRLICTAQRMTPEYFSAQEDACEQSSKNPETADRITKNIYDKAGQLLQVQKAIGTTDVQAYATYAYSDNGKQTLMIDANGNQSSFTYDGFDQRSRWSFPSKTKAKSYDISSVEKAKETAGKVSEDDYEEYGYDKNGNRTRFVRRDGKEFTYEYDALNRLVVKKVPDNCTAQKPSDCPPSEATRDVYYGYDLQGRQLYARFDSSTGSDGVLMSYDALGRQLTSTTNMGLTSRTVSSTYDPMGNRQSVTTPGGTWYYSYDDANRLISLNECGDASCKEKSARSSWAYNADGQLSGLTESGSSGVTLIYDGAGRIKTKEDTFLNNIGNNKLEYIHNAAGQITKSESKNPDYTYRDAYNILRKYDNNGLNQYVGAGDLKLSYDKNGNIVNDGNIEYLYDYENRLIKAGNTTFIYDPTGRLWQISGQSEQVQFLYDGDQLAAEFDASGALTNSYVHGPMADDPILWYSGKEGARWYHSDRLGSITAITKSSSGSLQQINTYDAYGIPGIKNTGRFQYTGQIWIPDLGMYYYKARFYSPSLGRFLQTDPIGYDDQINLYAYVANDPVNQRDPDGKQSVPMIGSNYDTDSQIRAACGGNSTCEQQARKDAAEVAITGLSFAPIGGVAVKGAEWGVREIQAYRAYYVIENAKTGLTVFQTKSIATFFGKGVDGAKAALAKIGESGFKLPRGVTADTLQKYKSVAERAIEAGKTPEVQRARIEVIDEALKRINK